MLFLIGIHLVVALPFKAWVLIPSFTDIRPVSGLLPIYGIYLGPIGGFATAIANSIEDGLSDMLTWSSIGGFLSNLLVPYLYYKLWDLLLKKPFQVKNLGDLGGYTILSAILAGFHACIVSLGVSLVSPEVQFLSVALTIFVNNFFFSMVLGLPLSILLQSQFGHRCFSDKRGCYGI